LIVFGLLELVPAIGSVLGAIGLLFTIVTSLVALRASLDIGWGRALLLLVLSVVALLPLSVALTWLT
jgi:Ca2+/Na+ antiporter